MINETPKAGDVYSQGYEMKWLIISYNSDDSWLAIVSNRGISSHNICGLFSDYVEEMSLKKIGINGKFDPQGEPKITFDKVEV